MQLEDRILLVLRAIDHGDGVDAVTVSKVTLLIGFGQNWEDMVLHRSQLGPTSVSVWDALDRLEARKLIGRTPDSQPGWSRQYSITPAGVERAAKIETESVIEASRILNSVDALTASASVHDARALSAASRIVYQIESGDKPLAELVVNTSRLQGWELSDELLESTAKLVATVRPSISTSEAVIEVAFPAETAEPDEIRTS